MLDHLSATGPQSNEIQPVPFSLSVSRLMSKLRCSVFFFLQEWHVLGLNILLIAGFEDGQEAMSQRMQAASKNWKRQKNGSPLLEPLE